MNNTEKKIIRVLNSAYNEVPYFNNVINEMLSESDESDADFLTIELFERLPIFDKRRILKIGWENFVSERYLDEEYQANLTSARLERTSGTTGRPMSILWSNRDYFSSGRYHWSYRSQFFRITPHSRMCTSSKYIPGNDVCYTDPAGNKMTFSIKELNCKTIPRIFAHLHAFQPEWLYIQNSVLYVLLYYAKRLELHFPKSIRYIEYIGEPLCPYYRTEIEKWIPVPSSNMYGCVETNGIAYECSQGHFHLMVDNIYLEIVDREGHPLPAGETGYVCVTGLHNVAMPMLRYRLNDRAHLLTHQDCPCGNPSQMIKLDAARFPSYLILDDLAVYSKAALYYPMNGGLECPHVEPTDFLFNLRMNELDHYEVLLYQNSDIKTDVAAVLSDLIRAYGLSAIRFSVQMIDEQLPSLPAGILRVRSSQ